MPSTRKRAQLGRLLLRVATALLLAIHGWFRLLEGTVGVFGEWLSSQGIPAGSAVAATITALEILGTPLLALGHFLRPLAAIYAAYLIAGIIMVHGPEGWFVVGGGRNGAEYSFLLVVCLTSIAMMHDAPTA
jgi:putative oxidoreductase